MTDRWRLGPFDFCPLYLVLKAVCVGFTRRLIAAQVTALVALLAVTIVTPALAQTPDPAKTAVSGELNPDQQAALTSALRTIAPGIGKDLKSDELNDGKRVQRGRTLYMSRGSLADLSDLSESQREDLAAYYQNVLSRAQDAAATLLDSADRSALAVFQDYVRRHGVTPPDTSPGSQKAEAQSTPEPNKTSAPPRGVSAPSRSPTMARSAPTPGQSPAPAVGTPSTELSSDNQGAPKSVASDASSITPESAKQFQDDLTKRATEEQARRDKAHLEHLYGGKDALPKPLPGDMEERLKKQAEESPSTTSDDGAAPVAEPPNPPNRFAGLGDRRRGWLPAAKPPTEAEIHAHPELLLEGNWRIEWRGHPEFASAKIWILKGYKLDSDCGLEGAYESCRDPAAPLSLYGGLARVHDGRNVGHHYKVKVLPDGSEIQVDHQGSTDGPFTSVLRRQPGNPDVLIGRWKNSEGKSGAEIWRREPRPVISRVECVKNTDLNARTVGNATQPCTAVVRGNAPKDAMRGNLPGFLIDIFGTNMDGAGPLPIFLDWAKTHAEVNSYCYLYEKPFYPNEAHGCASWGDPSPDYGEIIGVRAVINVMYGARPGLKTLWVAGQPVRFYLRLPDFPKTAQPDASLQSLDVIAPSGDALEKIGELKPFALKAVFDRAAKAATITVEAPGMQPEARGGTSGNGNGPRSLITLYRTEDSKVFRSSLLVVKRIGPTGERDRLSFSRTIAGHNADRSAEIAKTLANRWSVQQTADGGGSAGTATVAADGRHVSMTLAGTEGQRRFESLEIDAEELGPEDSQDGPQPGAQRQASKLLLTVRFEEVPVPPRHSQSGQAGTSQAERLVVLPVPRANQQLTFKLDDKSTTRAIAWRTGSGRFRMALESKGGQDRLEGPWYEETEEQHLREAGRYIWTRGEPKIAGVVVLEDQLGRPRAGTVGITGTSVYPFKPDGTANAGSQWRTLFVYGRNLPKSGEPVALQSDVATIEYEPAFFDKSQEQHLLDQGWAKLGDKRGKNDAALLVRAKLKQKVTPGVKKMTLNGQTGYWPLVFSDQLAVMRFVRAGGDAEREATDVFYTSDIGFVELKYEIAIPFKQIDINLFKGTALSTDGKLKGDDARVGVVVAKPLSDGDGKTYRTEPIHLFRNDRPDHRPPDDPKADLLDVRPEQIIKAQLADRVQGIAVPPIAQATIYASPDQLTQSPLWEDALRGVARCNGQAPDEDSLKDGSYARQESQNVSSAFLSNDYSISLKNGDHAAAILIRDEFVEQTAKRLPEYQKLANTPIAVKQFREAARRSGDAASQPFWSGNTAQFVKKGSLGDSTEEIPLWQTLDTDWLSQNYKISREVAEARALYYTRKALERQHTLMQRAIDRANAAGDCKLDELLVIAGYRSPRLVNGILPRLVKLKKTTNPDREFWVPDNVARGYVKGLYVAGEAVRALDKYSDLAQLTAFSFAAIATPVGLAAFGANTVAAGASVAIDAADAAYFGGKGLMKYFGDQSKLDYALGAAPAAGNDFYADTAATRQTGLATIVGVAVPAGFAALGAKAARALKGMELVRTRPNVLGNLDSLTAAERRNVSTYLEEVANSAEHLRIREATGSTRSAYADLKRLADDVATSGAEGGAKVVSAADQHLLHSVEDFLAKNTAKDAAKTGDQEVAAKRAEGDTSAVDNGSPTPSSGGGRPAAPEAAEASGSAKAGVGNAGEPGTASSAGRRDVAAADSEPTKTPSSNGGGRPATSEPAEAPASGQLRNEDGVPSGKATSSSEREVASAESAPARTPDESGDGAGPRASPAESSASDTPPGSGAERPGTQRLSNRPGETEPAKTAQTPVDVPGTQRLSNPPGETEPAATAQTPVDVPGTQRLSNRPGGTEPTGTEHASVEVPGTVKLSNRRGGTEPESPQQSAEAPGSAGSRAPGAGSAPAPASPEIWDNWKDWASSSPPSRLVAGSDPTSELSQYGERAISPVRTSNGPATGIRRVSPDGSIWETAEGERLHEAEAVGNGGFADTSRLRDADDNPSGLVKKNYRPDTGDFGIGRRRHDPALDPYMADIQRKVVEDSVYGSALLKDADILQAEIVGYEVTADGGYLVQREIGNKASLPENVEKEIILKQRLEQGDLSRDEMEAIVDLFKKLDDRKIAWEDPNTGNVFLRTYKDGKVEAGILDTDRIGIWDDLKEPRDTTLIRFRDDFRTNPADTDHPAGIIASMPPGGLEKFGSVKQFNNKMRERMGYWGYHKGVGFYGRILNYRTMRTHFPELPNNLPQGWRPWANPPAGFKPGTQGLLWPGDKVFRFVQRAGPPERAFGRRPTSHADRGSESLAIAA